MNLTGTMIPFRAGDARFLMAENLQTMNCGNFSRRSTGIWNCPLC